MGVTRKALQQKRLDWEPSERPEAGKLVFLVLGFFLVFFLDEWLLEVLNVDSQIDLDRLHCFLDLMRTPLVLKIYH